MIEEDHDIINIEEVVREMNEEPREVMPEPVSSFASSRTFVIKSDTFKKLLAVIFVSYASILLC